MNQIAATRWPPMVSGPEEEFAHFFEFGDLQQLSFPPFEPPVQDGGELQQEPGGAMDTPMGNEEGVLELEDGQNHQEMNQRNPLRFMAGYQGPPESFHEIDMQTELFNPHQQQPLQIHGPQYRGQNIIPPTPNSMEMHGDQAHYYRAPGEHHTQSTYERYGRNQSQNQKDQVRIFTTRGIS